NSNPATIMTDPELADRTYIEPVTPEWVRRVIERERPDALLPTMGGQTALNVAMALARDGTLARHGVELIGANARAIQMAEDRAEFAAAMRRIGLATPVGRVAASVADALTIVTETGYPAILRPSFTLGGTGGGVAYNRAEFEELVERALDLSPVHTTLIERSVLGWKEFELEVMRDHRDNVVIVCSIENVDPMGVHTGDSITVAPARTLTDRDYVVVKVPRFAFGKFPTADFRPTTQMKSVGEARAIGRTFKEAFQKGLRALEAGRSGWTLGPTLADDRLTSDSPEDLRVALR